MSKEVILNSFKEITKLQQVIDKKVEETRKSYEAFLADQSIDLKERYLLWLNAPSNLHHLKDLSSIKGKVGKGLYILMDCLTGAFYYDSEVDLPSVFPDYFYTDEDELIGYELSNYININEENNKIFYDTLNYIVSHNIGTTYQWLES